MPTAIQDLRFGLRTLLRNKVFSLVAILSIGLGIAVNATVFIEKHGDDMRTTSVLHRREHHSKERPLVASGEEGCRRTPG